MVRLLAVLIFSAALLAQTVEKPFVVIRSSALSGATEVITVQYPAASTGRVIMEGVSVYCSVDCADVTIERDGTLATATAITPAKVNASGAALSIQAYRSSDVGAGTVIGRAVVPAGALLMLEYRRKELRPGDTFTVKIPSITGTAIVIVTGSEY